SEAAGAMVLVVGLVSPFATYVPIQVSHNIGLMPFWALALAAGWFAFERGRLVDWAVLGLAVGFGLWAKYAIAQLMVPLAVAFLAVPHWRQRLFTVGPWIAALLAAVVILPHALDVVAQGSTTISFATRTLPATLPQRIGFVGGVLLNSALLMLPMALLAALVAGGAASL
ncbi:MAG: glycosyltransferase family 39 protein, partial [Hyphomicrobiales bacterium]|nr:glycosyltransferase family 39 protein [Hyphomicrobiales bacterium]